MNEQKSDSAPPPGYPNALERMLGCLSFGVALPSLASVLLPLAPLVRSEGGSRRTKLSGVRLAFIMVAVPPLLLLAAVVLLPIGLAAAAFERLGLVHRLRREIDPELSRPAHHVEALEVLLRDAAVSRRAWAVYKPSYEYEGDVLSPSLELGVVNPKADDARNLCGALADLGREYLLGADDAVPGISISVALQRDRGAWGFSFSSQIDHAAYWLDGSLKVVSEPVPFAPRRSAAT